MTTSRTGVSRCGEGEAEGVGDTAGQQAALARELLPPTRLRLEGLVMMGGVGMNGFGVMLVVELCEAIADYVDEAPAAAAKTARKLGATLRKMHDDNAKRETDILRAQRGQF